MKTQYFLGISALLLAAAGQTVACNSGSGAGGSGGATGTTTTGATMTTGASMTTSGTMTTGASMTTSTTGSGSTSTGMMIPPAPMLGAQIDRMGRPAINTALNHLLDSNATTKTAAKDTYNQDTNRAGWVAAYSGEFAKNLAIFDGLDANCGNQVLYKAPASTTSYTTLAAVLADDALYLDTSKSTCAQYLGVEANAVGLTNMDCGGRKLTYDVIDTTYSAVAIGAFTGVGDGIASDADTQSGTFPYIAAPH